MTAFLQKRTSQKKIISSFFLTIFSPYCYRLSTPDHGFYFIFFNISNFKRVFSLQCEFIVNCPTLSQLQKVMTKEITVIIKGKSKKDYTLNTYFMVVLKLFKTSPETALREDFKIAPVKGVCVFGNYFQHPM